jgi:hypothetical protein
MEVTTVKTGRAKVLQTEPRIPITARDRKDIDIYIRNAKNGNNLLKQKNISPLTLKTILVNGYAFASQYNMLHDFISDIKKQAGIKD